ncbi:ribose-phosphate pyrophosphokinase [Candidatus Gottesmanbacteria bacterium]|nr:ribose-phosphate pyrophosphokinase [Candidatus Gottesmanbacteria bacterium]
MKNFLLFSGSSNRSLAQDVAKRLGVPLGKVDLERFADGEVRPWIQEDVRDTTVFVLQSLSYPMDEHIMELTLMGDAIRRGAPKTMIAIVPYFGYARQDKLHRVGEPVSARVIAKILEISKFKEVITVDLHNDAIVGFFQVPVTHVSALSLLVAELKKMNLTGAVAVSPDVGGIKRARNFAYALDIPLAVIEKKRYLDRRDTSEAFEIIGCDIGKTVIIIDDMISTGGTIAHSTQSLVEAGAKRILVCATHGVLAGEALKNLEHAAIERVIVTNTIAIPPEKQLAKMKLVSIAPLIADAISQIVR